MMHPPMGSTLFILLSPECDLFVTRQTTLMWRSMNDCGPRTAKSNSRNAVTTKCSPFFTHRLCFPTDCIGMYRALSLYC